MPKVGQPITTTQKTVTKSNVEVKPWFRQTPIAKVVNQLVARKINPNKPSKELTKLVGKLTKKQVAEVVTMYNAWKEDVAAKVHMAIELSKSSRLSRRY